MRIASTRDCSWYDTAGPTAKMTWDASEARLGIGTTGPSTALHVAGEITLDTDNAIRWEDSNTQIYGSGDSGSQYINFATAGAERMRITGDGALAFGGATNYGDSGQVLTSAGSSAVPTWTAAGAGTVTSITPAADSGTGTAITTSGTLTFTGGTNVTTSVSGTTVTVNSADQYSGTVTSIGVTTNEGLKTSTGSSLTSSGTLGMDINSLTSITGDHASGWSIGDEIAVVDSGAASDPTKKIKLPAEIGIACSDETTVIDSTGVKATLLVPRAMTITEIKLSLTTADTTGLTLNVENRAADPSASGSNILSAALDSSTGYYATGTSMSGYNALSVNQFVAVNVTGVGDSSAAGLKVWLLGYWT